MRVVWLVLEILGGWFVVSLAAVGAWVLARGRLHHIDGGDDDTEDDIAEMRRHWIEYIRTNAGPNWVKAQSEAIASLPVVEPDR